MCTHYNDIRQILVHIMKNWAHGVVRCIMQGCGTQFNVS